MNANQNIALIILVIIGVVLFAVLWFLFTLEDDEQLFLESYQRFESICILSEYEPDECLLIWAGRE